MAAFENLFAARSYESMASEYRFLELFSGKILSAIDPTAFHNKVTIFRSGPGGGKTSLLRLLGPEPLLRICGNRDANSEVHDALWDLGALAGDGPRVLSVYQRLDSYDILSKEERGADMRGLYTLLGARLTMKWLSGLLSMRGLGHKHMDKVEIGIPLSGRTLPGSPIPCNGRELYEWAARTEDAICGAAGSLGGGGTVDDAMRFTGLDHIHMMAPGHVTVDGEPAAARPMIALDDLHRLNDTQRRLLIEHMCEARYPAPVWLAERLDAFSLAGSFNGINGREYDTVDLEEYWEGREGEFESFARSISEKRTREASTGLGIMPLPHHLDDGMPPQLGGDVRAALEGVRARVRAKSGRRPLYGKWVAKAEIPGGRSSLLDSLATWKMLEIKIARHEKNGIGQQPAASPGEASEGGDDARIREAAELMLCTEFGLPYYYGFRKIAALATFNIEVLLELSSELLERLVAQILLDTTNRKIDARDQQEIIKGVAGRRWNDIERMNANGGDVRRFLESFCRFATGANAPDAPYAQGVTGFGITAAAWEEIRGRRTEAARRLNGVLHTCLAQNYLKPAGAGQGGDPRAILHLNGLFCAHNGLPVGRGSWMPRSTSDLAEWLDGGDGGDGGGNGAPAKGGRHP